MSKNKKPAICQMSPLQLFTPRGRSICNLFVLLFLCFTSPVTLQEAGGSRTKLESLIEFPVTEQLDLSTFIDANNNHRCLSDTEDTASGTATDQKQNNSCSESHAYDLYAVCSHSGSLHSGHYTGIIHL